MTPLMTYIFPFRFSLTLLVFTVKLALCVWHGV